MTPTWMNRTERPGTSHEKKRWVTACGRWEIGPAYSQSQRYTRNNDLYGVRLYTLIDRSHPSASIEGTIGELKRLVKMRNN